MQEPLVRLKKREGNMRIVGREITEETEVKVLFKVEDEVEEFAAPVILEGFQG